MKRTEIEKAIMEYRAFCLGNVKDRGRMGKVLEVMTRDYILKNGIGSVADCKARKLGQDDIRTPKDGCIEIKSGAGVVFYGDGLTKDDLNENHVLPDIDLVVWYPWANVAIDNNNTFDYGWVFTRKQFIETLEKLGRYGLRSMIHVTAKGAQINLQALSARHENILYDILENFPTVTEYWKN